MQENDLSTFESSSTREIAAGLFLSHADLEIPEPVVFDASTFQAAALSIVLDGHSTSQTKSVDRGFQPGELWIGTDNEPRPCKTLLHPGRLRMVELVVTPTWLQAQEEDPAIEGLMEAVDHPIRVQRLRLDHELHKLAESVVACPRPGALGRLAAESQALSLLIRLADLHGLSRIHAAQAVRRRDLDRMVAVRDRIDCSPLAVASVASIAAEFGVSTRKLQRDFFAAFGRCVAAHIGEKRLELACDLLEEGLSVSETAYRIGYDHPGNFSAAFKRRFGVPPKSFRR